MASEFRPKGSKKYVITYRDEHSRLRKKVWLLRRHVPVDNGARPDGSLLIDRRSRTSMSVA
jgi:hypothetical protein